MQRGTKPDVVTLNTLVRGWCKRGDMEMATKVFDLASKMNVVPMSGLTTP